MSKKRSKNKKIKRPSIVYNPEYSRIIKEPQWKRMDEQLQLEMEDVFLTMKNSGSI